MSCEESYLINPVFSISAFCNCWFHKGILAQFLSYDEDASYQIAFRIRKRPSAILLIHLKDSFCLNLELVIHNLEPG